MMLISKKTKEDQVAFLEKMLRDMAMERIGKRLDEHNRLLARDLDKLRMESFGLGAESITAVAGLELTREQIRGREGALREVPEHTGARLSPEEEACAPRAGGRRAVR